MRFVGRVARTLLLGIALVALLPTATSQGRGASHASILIISPPPGIWVPMGQALEVRYRVSGTAARSELWSDGELIFVSPALSGQEVARAWAPAEAARHSLTVCVFDQEGVLLVAIERMVVGLPPGSPARISSAAEDAFDLSKSQFVRFQPVYDRRSGVTDLLRAQVLNLLNLSNMPRCVTRGGAP